MSQDTKRTALYDQHVAAGGKLVPFAGWEMPLHYGSQLAEHHAVRKSAGMFDVSHMTVVDIAGDSALAFLQRVVANDVAKLEQDTALYGAALNEAGGILDDLIVYRTRAGYRVVVNASTRDKMLRWFDVQNTDNTQIPERDLAMVAVQGPEARRMFADASGVPGIVDMAPFTAIQHESWLIGCTGYTGEDGVEVMLPGDAAVSLWQTLTAAGVQPAGLAARDTLRLEAGLNLYGQDMDEDILPLQSNIGWTIAWQPEERQFVGREALQQARAAGVASKLTGLLITGKGIPRHGQRVITPAGDGVVTSGVFSPTLSQGIALVRVPNAAKGDVAVEIRGKQVAARLVKPPFVRNGKSRVAQA